MDNNNKYKEALKGLAKSLELEPDLGALHSQQNALMLGFNGAIHARHNPSVWSTFIRQYFCLLVSNVISCNANDLRSLLQSNATPKSIRLLKQIITDSAKRRMQSDHKNTTIPH